MEWVSFIPINNIYNGNLFDFKKTENHLMYFYVTRGKITFKLSIRVLFKFQWYKYVAVVCQLFLFICKLYYKMIIILLTNSTKL